MTRELWKWGRAWGRGCWRWATRLGGRLNPKGLWALVLLTVLLLARSVGAQEASTESDERLVEGNSELVSNHRLACGSKFCVWSETASLGPCFVGTCYSTSLSVTDLKGKRLGAYSENGDLSGGRARFLGPRQVELVGLGGLEDSNGDDPEGRPRELGFSAAVMRRRLLTFSPDGSKIVSDTWEWLSPKRHALLEGRLKKFRAGVEPKIKGRIPDAVLTKAQKVCEAEEGAEVKPTLYECQDGGGCVLVLNRAPEDRPSSCALKVKGGKVERLSLGKLMDDDGDPYQFSLESARYCFMCSICGYRGSSGNTQCVSRTRPDHMAFVETAGLHVDSGKTYPAQKASSAAEGAAKALTVHAYTMAHVSWGLGHWRDDKDLSMAWQAMRVGEELRFQVEVDDDVLQPLGDGPAVHSDHLELDFRGPSAQLKLGVLLAADGQVQVRLWKKGEGKKALDVDEAYAAAGSWSKTERGYKVDVSLPLAPLREALGVQKTLSFGMVASDADEKNQQETLLGNDGSLDFWDEYPPTIQEYTQVRAWD